MADAGGNFELREGGFRGLMGEGVDSRTAVAALGADELRQWAYLCVDGLAARCDEINELNVFPIPDSDTGTNLVFTVRSAVEAMRAAGPDADVEAVAAALAHGAVSGARGNSGVIVSQVLRSVAETARRGPLDSTAVKTMIGRAAELARTVVSVPVEGTIVTVLEHVTSTLAVTDASSDLGSVVVRAADAAADGLVRTRGQLPVLDAAGVVDAGALGLLVMLDALATVVTGTVPDRPRFHRAVVARRHTVTTSAQLAAPRHPETRHPEFVGYEVVYRITGLDDDGVIGLRSSLSELGDSVVVAGDGSGTWSAHVHTADAGSAIEAGLRAGRIHDVTVSAFTSEDDIDHGHEAVDRVYGRDILAVVAGDGAEELYVEEGATVLRCDTVPLGTAELCAAIVGSEHSEVLVLPNGALSAQELVSVSIASRTAGKDVLMLPSSAMVQGLAALAVHDPTRAAVDDAFAMSEAAAGTRWASLRVADERSLTWVGTCEPGDGLGLVGPEVVVIGPDVVAAGRDLLDQLLSVGGEMVTMLRGEARPGDVDVQAVTAELAKYVSLRHPGVEVVVYSGDQPGDVVQLGVE